MKAIRRIGELNARVVSLEDRVSAIEAELVGLRPPSVSIDTLTRMDVSPSVEHVAEVTMTTKTGASVWADGKLLSFDTITKVEVSA